MSGHRNWSTIRDKILADPTRAARVAVHRRAQDALLALTEPAGHEVHTFAWPMGGGTAYGAHCHRCATSWSSRDLNTARTLLADFRAERCPRDAETPRPPGR